MTIELQALEYNKKWEFVHFPSGKKKAGCHWIYAIKVGPNGEVDCLKAKLATKELLRSMGLTRMIFFSLVAKMTIVRLFLAIITIRHLPLHQLHIKNVFVNSGLKKEVYMEQSPGFGAQGESGLVCKLRHSLIGLKQFSRAWFGKFSHIIQSFGLKCSEEDHSVFYCHTSLGKCVHNIMYVDDIYSHYRE